MPSPRLLVLALATALLPVLCAPPDAQAQRRRPAKPAAIPAACTDFHALANADWLAAHPVPATGAVTALGQLGERARQQQIQLLEQAARSPANPVQKLLGDFWISGMDDRAVEADGSTPIAPLLARINAIKRNKELPATLAALHQVGIPVAFHFSPDIDLKALDRHIGYFMQGGIGLPDPAFLVRNDRDTAVLLSRYKDYIKQILALTGTPGARLEAEATAVIALERRLAAQSRPLTEISNPFNNHAPVAVSDLARQYRHLQLDAFLKAQGVNDDTVSLSEPALFQTLDAMVQSLPVADWKAYLRWRVGDAMAPYLSSAYREAEFAFRGRLLRGQTLPPTRSEQVLEAINVAAGPMLGREYTNGHLDGETRRQAALVIDRLRDTLMASLSAHPQMTDAARNEAIAKLRAMKIEIGAPLRDLDYSIQPMGRGSFGSNMLIAATWRHREEMKRIGRGNADRRWDVLPQQPALFYDIAQNRLIATAAVLQSPVFPGGGDAASLYGSFGSLAGHELTRAVDPKGAHIDAAGQLRTWWTPAEQSSWATLSSRLSSQLANQPWPGVVGMSVDPGRVVESALGDLSGVQLAWKTWQSVAVTSDASRAPGFFTAWARLWAQAVSPNEAVARAAADTHLPGILRTHLPLSNMDSFSQTFGCSAGQPMSRPVAERLQPWP